MTVHAHSFPPSAEFAAAANVDADIYLAAHADPKGFWEEQARLLQWAQEWHSVVEVGAAGEASWFPGGRLNVSVNCLDRHVDAGFGSQVAIHWVGENGDIRDLTYSELLVAVSRVANGLLELGLTAGDRVVIQLPMIPEVVIAMLACARLGLVHSVVFGGFSPAQLRARVEDAGARVVITADGQFRRGEAVPMKSGVDDAVGDLEIDHVVVVRRTGETTPMRESRDIWWHDLVADQPDTHVAEAFDASHPLFILYTSGTTGKPKGIQHSSGGYLTQAASTFRTVFDLKPDSDVYWCAADVGWITGHTYVVYAPLANRVTQVIYEGTPNTPHEGRHFEIIDRYGVTIYYIAPTLIRTFMKWGEQVPAAYSLESLRLLGSVGEPINPEAWRWYRTHIGRDRAPIVDTWWQTETGAIMIAPLPGVTATKPGSAQRALPGISVLIVDENGQQVAPGEAGYLVITHPWPSMLTGIWGDRERARETYWDRFKDQGFYFAGDGARYDDDGDIWMLGRIDDVMNVSGHRISTSEVESALVTHPSVAEAAVVGADDPVTGQAIVAFVILRRSSVRADDDATHAQLSAHVAREIGPIAKPKRVIVVPELPKTRSGKIMRRLLRDIAEEREIGDTATLADTSSVQAISERFSRQAPAHPATTVSP